MTEQNKKKYDKIVLYHEKLGCPSVKEAEILQEYCKELGIPFSEYSGVSKAFIPIIKKGKETESQETILGKMFFALLIKNEIEWFMAEYADSNHRPLVPYNENRTECSKFFESLDYLYEKILKIEQWLNG